jgi:hypothetical protein
VISPLTELTFMSLANASASISPLTDESRCSPSMPLTEMFALTVPASRVDARGASIVSSVPS